MKLGKWAQLWCFLVAYKIYNSTTSSIKFGIFYIIWYNQKLMKCIWNFILNQSTENIVELSTNILSNLWNDIHIYMENNNNFSTSFQEDDLSLFLAKIWLIVYLFKESFVILLCSKYYSDYRSTGRIIWASCDSKIGWWIWYSKMYILTWEVYWYC